MKRVEVLKAEIDKLSLLDGGENEYIRKMMDILGNDVPEDMARAISFFILTAQFAHFRQRIKISEGNLVPANMIGFILARSGAKKTSSLSALERATQQITNKVQAQRTIEQATLKGQDNVRVTPLSNAIATEAGMVKRLNDMAKESLGMPYMFVDEISTELATSPDIVSNIKLVAQLFDEGNMKSRPLKDIEMEGEEVRGMGMSALFIGSEAGILNDEDILKKFLLEFISKLARRSFFVYPTFVEKDFELSDIDKILDEEVVIRRKKEQAILELNQYSEKIFDFWSMRLHEDAAMEISEETMRAYNIYKLYCEDLAEPMHDETLLLEQQHRHWKALKVAGALAGWRMSETVELQDLIEGIAFAEKCAGQLQRFLDMAQRQPFEIIADHYAAGGDPYKIHDWQKRKWIKKQADVHDLIAVVNSQLGKIGYIELEGDWLLFREHESVSKEGHGVSYVIVPGSKEEKARNCATGYQYDRVEFKDLAQVMANDTAYCAWEFENGIRGKNYLLGGATFLVLDIDYSEDTDTEISNLLADYNNIVCRTSNGDNPYKFRVILESDVVIDVDDGQYKQLLEKVGEDLGITVDTLPRAQIFFGYSNRNPIINIDAEPYPVSEMLTRLDKPKVLHQMLTPQKLDRVWEDRFIVFKWFYDINTPEKRQKHGHHKTLWLAAMYGHDIGVDYDTMCKILEDLIDYRGLETRSGYLDQMKRSMKRLRNYKHTEEVEQKW